VKFLVFQILGFILHTAFVFCPNFGAFGLWVPTKLATCLWVKCGKQLLAIILLLNTEVIEETSEVEEADENVSVERSAVHETGISISTFHCCND